MRTFVGKSVRGGRGPLAGGKAGGPGAGEKPRGRRETAEPGGLRVSRLFDTGAVAHVGGMLWPEPEVFQRTEDTIVVPREALVPDCA